MKRSLTLLSAVILTASAFAQAPEKMSYQAVVRDAGNALVTSQAVGMQLSILQGSVSGTAVYVETQNPTTNINGLVSIEIGSGTVVSGTFNAIDWSAGPYFIKTETDPTGGTAYTITGTSQMMSVPYALYAKTAENATNDLVDDADADPTNEMNTGVVLNGTDLEVTDGNGTIVTDLSSLQDGVTDADADPTNEMNTGVILNGTDLEVTDGNGTIVTDLSSLQDGVNDADADPTNELNTAVVLSGNSLKTTDAGGTISTDLTPLVNAGWKLAGNTGTNSSTDFVGTTDARDLVFKTLNNERMRINSSGNVGIGTGTGASFFTTRLIIRGSSTLGTSDALLVENSAGTDILTIQNDGCVGINANPSSIYQLYNSVPTTSTASYAIRNNFSRSTTSTATTTMYGLHNNVSRPSGAGGGTTYGIYTRASNLTGSGTTYGIYATVSSLSSTTRYAGYFAGDVFSSGSYLPSDERLKRNISDYDNALSKINAIAVKEYEYIHDGDMSKMDLPKGRQVGIMAQDLENIFPQLTKDSEFDLNLDPDNEDPNRKENILGFKAVNYTGMVPILTKAMQEQQEQIKAQEEKNSELQKTVLDLQQRLEALESEK